MVGVIIPEFMALMNSPQFFVIYIYATSIMKELVMAVSFNKSLKSKLLSKIHFTGFSGIDADLQSI